MTYHKRKRHKIIIKSIEKGKDIVKLTDVILNCHHYPHHHFPLYFFLFLFVTFFIKSTFSFNVIQKNHFNLHQVA